MSWFHSNITSKEAVSLLMKDVSDGSFLVRRSEHHSNNFTLAVRRGRTVHHITICNNGEFFFIKDDEQFSSLAALVDQIRRIPIFDEKGAKIILGEPLYDKVPTKENWYHGSISGQEAENMLCQRAKDGYFLVRQSRHSPGALVLSVLQNSKVIHFPIYNASNAFQVKGSTLKFESLSKLIEHFQCTEIKLNKGSTMQLTEGLHATRFAALDVKKRMMELGGLNAENEDTAPLGYKMEYDQLQKIEMETSGSDEYHTSVGARIENKKKNRYKNILPFNKTRVQLIDFADADESNDYINANYIVCDEQFNSNNKKYIATQGPLKKTIVDFWRMISQENVHIIVMTTKEVEADKNKCVRYWPTSEDEHVDCEVQKGILRISFVSEDTHSDYVLRVFQLVQWIESEEDDDELTQFGESRIIIHFQYVGWPDHGVPNLTGILSFLSDINQYRKKFGGHLVVHCSAGIGRTGTIIIIDLLMNEIKSKGLSTSIDIFEAVKSIRLQRSGMVQTETQYQFIYQAIRQFVENFALNPDDVYSNEFIEQSETE